MVLAQSPHGKEKTIQWGDLPETIQQWCQTRQLSASSFEQFVLSIKQQTAERERNGEYDHLIHFALQSTRFTKQTRIEPAISAYAFVQSLAEEERTRYLHDDVYVPKKLVLPRAVTDRLQALMNALKRSHTDERMAYFQRFLANTMTRDESKLDRLHQEYARAMKFLYRKEFLSRSIKTPTELTAYVASLYQERGHSTDTQFEANFALHQALEAIKATAPNTQINRVLIVGPGLDFAPRTDLMDAFGPQCYQPFAVADALLSLQLTQRANLQIHCLDINDRVVSFIRNFPARKNKDLTLISGLANDQNHQLTDEYQAYFRNFGKFIGSTSPVSLGADLANHLRKRLQIDAAIATQLSADKLNIITERYTPSPDYDLVIVTNVFPYFDEMQLALALSNISAMMKPGAYLLHNEPRPLPALAVGLPLQQARTILLAKGKQGELFDGIAIHQKCSPKC